MANKKILIKISGEALQESNSDLIYSKEILSSICDQIYKLSKQGYLIGIVIGGGNIWRGKLSDKLNIVQESGHYMGMLSTVINSIAMSSMLENNYKVKTNIINSLEVIIPNKYIKYDPENVSEYFVEGTINIFAGGTGKPFFSTDTSVVRKAIASGAKEILIAKNGTDGVYDKDPNVYNDASFISNISFEDALAKNINVMDRSAIEELSGKDITVKVFDMKAKDSIINSLLDNSFKMTIMKKGDK